MDESVRNSLLGLKFEAAQEFKNMAVFPLLSAVDGGPDYLTLKEALEKALLTVTEVSAGGSVPELKVANAADLAVLLLDGEELAGAKQNRVLNTSILLREKSELVIPVSCTERGRWSYVSNAFRDSDTVMSPKLRGEKAKTVAISLSATGEFRADQGKVWDGIKEMEHKTQVISRTGAMKAVYEAKTQDLNEYLRAFNRVPEQKGVLVYLNGEPVGFDFLSKEKAFETLFPKLIKSYAMEAILDQKQAAGPQGTRDPEGFLKEAAGCEEKKYPSVGLGSDYRYEGTLIVGSALTVDGHVVHMAFFRVTESDRTGNMADTRQRRRFRV
ncbi:MAG: hypothetical protein A2W03_12225 [Candidatus Aminicenantes bacterium RBG_16_63_16]|nr:MAG: hypothetical protein A2W03_12225 [Candidatus Aminicenantes bacterium RBG_16_63_16]